MYESKLNSFFLLVPFSREGVFHSRFGLIIARVSPLRRRQNVAAIATLQTAGSMILCSIAFAGV